MIHIKKQTSHKKAGMQMSGVLEGDTVIVSIGRKKISCVARQCARTACASCVLHNEGCLLFSGDWHVSTRKSFIPLEDVVE